MVELEEVHASDRFSRSQLRYLMSRANGTVLVAEEQLGGDRAEVLGNAIALFRMGASSAHLYSLTVDPRHQGRGVGRLLLGRIEEAAVARGLARLHLEVRSDNEGAIGLYLSAGFVETGHRPNYYADGKEALSMEKSLSPAR